MKKMVYLLLTLFCYACSGNSKEASELALNKTSSLEIPDENTLEGQAHRLLAETHPQTEYREFHFGATHIGTKQNMPKVYKIMQEQGLCTVEEKRVSRYPLCVLHLTPQALEYMQQDSKDSIASRLEGMQYKASFKLFDVRWFRNNGQWKCLT